MATLTYLQTAWNASDLSTYTFSAQNFGAASAGRYIIVAIGSRKAGASANVSSVTIGGVSATIIVNNPATATNTGYVGIVIAAVPTGTSGDVVVNFSGTMVRCTISLYSVEGINPTASDILEVDGTSLTGSIDVTDGGITIGVATNAANNPFTWTNLTEDYDNNETGESTFRHTAASLLESSTQTKTVTASATGLTTEAALGVAHFPLSAVATNSERAAKITGKAAWYNASWQYRVKVTVQASKVDADLTGYPVYVNLANLPAGFHSNVNQTDGRDIRVTTENGTTEVPREVVAYDSSADAGELHFKGNLANATDTDFYIYYGNAAATEPAAGDTYGKNNVWDSNFKGVWHLNEATLNGTTGEVKDSTTNANNGVGQGSSGYPATTTGKIGKGLNFTSANQHRISVPDHASLDITGEIAMEAWVNSASLTNNGILMKGALGGNQGCYSLIIATAGVGWYARLNGSQVEGSGQESGGTPTSAWHYVVAYRDGSNFKLRVDKVEIGSSAYLTAITPNNDPLYIGMYYDAAFGINGPMDEVRMHASGRTTAWFDATYENHNSPSTFYAVGSEESYGASTNISDDRAATIKGKDTANSERPATIKGKDTSNSDRAANIKGKDSSTSERSSKISGVATTNADRSAVVTGKDTNNSERPAKITGIEGSNDERAAKVHGIDTVTSDRSAKITGKNTFSADFIEVVFSPAAIDVTSERDAKITGIDTTNSERDAKITGSENANSDRDAKIIGKDFANSEVEAKITGQDSANDERDAKITGKDDATDERAAKLHGIAVDSSERSATVRGELTEASEIAAKIHGKDSSSSEVQATVKGQDTASSEVDAKVVGKDTAFSEFSAKIHGQDATDSEAQAKIVGKLAISEDRAAKIHGKQTDADERAAKIHGQNSAFGEILAKIRGSLATAFEVFARLVGKDTDSSERDSKIIGKASANDEIAAKIHGKDTANSEYSAKLHGKDTAASERGARIVGKITKERPTIISAPGGATTLGSSQNVTILPAGKDVTTISTKESKTVLTGSPPTTL